MTAAKPARAAMRRRGSVAVEAAVSLSIALLVIMAAFGALLAVYVDDEAQWSLMAVRDGIATSGVLFHGESTELFNTAALAVQGNATLASEFERRQIAQLVRLDAPLIPLADDYGNVVLSLPYRYGFGTLEPHSRFVIPAGGAFRSDGVDFEENTVYITNTGVKYHLNGCIHLRKSKYGISIEDAKARGYEPCKNCHGSGPFPPRP